MAKVQIKSEKLTPFGDFFRLWSYFWVSSPQLMMNSASSISSRNDLILNRNVGFLFAQ